MGAVQDGGEGVKLIDADALKIVSIGRKNGRKFVHADITDAPTVDAIPVEWLREKMRGYVSALRSTETAALVRVMQVWQQEQEGK